MRGGASPKVPRPLPTGAQRAAPPQRLQPAVFPVFILHDRPATEAASAAAAPDTRTLGQRLLRVWPYFRLHKGALGLAFLGALIAALTEPAIPALLQILLDEGFVAGSFPLWLVPVALMGLFAVRGLATFAAKYALSYVAAGAMVQMRRAMFERLNNAELSLFGEQSASKLSNTLVLSLIHI